MSLWCSILIHLPANTPGKSVEDDFVAWASVPFGNPDETPGFGLAQLPVLFPFEEWTSVWRTALSPSLFLYNSPFLKFSLHLSPEWKGLKHLNCHLLSLTGGRIRSRGARSWIKQYSKGQGVPSYDLNNFSNVFTPYSYMNMHMKAVFY